MADGHRILISCTLTLYQESGPIPDNGDMIGILEGDPVLLSGDDLLLLAQKRTNADGYWSVYPVGKYYMREGAVNVPDGNPQPVRLDQRSVGERRAAAGTSVTVSRHARGGAAL